MLFWPYQISLALRLFTLKSHGFTKTVMYRRELDLYQKMSKHCREPSHQKPFLWYYWTIITSKTHYTWLLFIKQGKEIKQVNSMITQDNLSLYRIYKNVSALQNSNSCAKYKIVHTRNQECIWNKKITNNTASGTPSFNVWCIQLHICVKRVCRYTLNISIIIFHGLYWQLVNDLRNRKDSWYFQGIFLASEMSYHYWQQV